MRILVCGGRHYSDHRTAFAKLDEIDQRESVSIVIEGGAAGADNLAHRWAIMRAKGHLRFFADWERNGHAAGPIRNQKMIDEGRPRLVVAFPGGRGTADMVRRAKAKGIEVIEVTAPPAPAIDDGPADGER